MRKKLIRNLILTLILSITLTGLIFSIWHRGMTGMGSEERQASALVFVLLTVFQPLIIALLSLPILLQINDTNFADLRTKLLYLAGSPLITTLILAFFFSSGIDTMTTAFLVPGTSFGLIHSLLYKRI